MKRKAINCMMDLLSPENPAFALLVKDWAKAQRGKRAASLYYTALSIVQPDWEGLT